MEKIYSVLKGTDMDDINGPQLAGLIGGGGLQLNN